MSDVAPSYSEIKDPYQKGPDYSKIPQRLHEYAASERGWKQR